MCQVKRREREREIGDVVKWPCNVISHVFLPAPPGSYCIEIATCYKEGNVPCRKLPCQELCLFQIATSSLLLLEEEECDYLFTH